MEKSLKPLRHFIKQVTAAVLLGLGSTLIVAAPATAATGKPEKAELKFGFIKLTDCAPVLIAKEKGFFEDEGLFVTVEAQANWKVLLDRVISGELDGASFPMGIFLSNCVTINFPPHILWCYHVMGQRH